MAKQSDDNLENFFLSRVDNYDIEYREEDWHRLNEMLNASEVMKAAALKQKMVWLGSGALLVISIVLLIWMSQNLTSRKMEDMEVVGGKEVNESSTNNSGLNEDELQPIIGEMNKEDSELIDQSNIQIEEIEEDPSGPSRKSRNLQEIKNQPLATKSSEIIDNTIDGEQSNPDQQDRTVIPGKNDGINHITQGETKISDNAGVALMSPSSTIWSKSSGRRSVLGSTFSKVPCSIDSVPASSS